MTGVELNKIINLSILIWVSRDISPLQLGNQNLEALLEGEVPFPGKWVKNESKKKTQGAVRPDDDPTCLGFDTFWEVYSFAKGSKADCKKIFAKIGEPDRILIKNTLHLYLASTCVKKEELFKPSRAYASRYLNGRYWDQYEAKRDMTVPVDFKYKDDYHTFIQGKNNEFPGLFESDQHLTCVEYQKVRDGDLKEHNINHIGPSVVISKLNKAYRQSSEQGGYVFDIFIGLCYG